jgi:hypothetical protein
VDFSSVVAESVLVRHQLLILNRGRKRAPNLHATDRIRFCCRRRGARIGLVHWRYGDAALDAQSSVPRSAVSGRSHHRGGSLASDVSAQLSSGLRDAARSGRVGGCEHVMRWVLRYAPEFEKRWQGYEKPVAVSWRVHETYIQVGALGPLLRISGGARGQTSLIEMEKFVLLPRRRPRCQGHEQDTHKIGT